MSGFSTSDHQDNLSNLLETFLVGSDQEAQQILQKYATIFLSDEAARRIEERIPALQQEYGQEPRIMEKIDRHYSFLKDARVLGVSLAIAKMDQENVQADSIAKQFLLADEHTIPALLQMFGSILMNLRTMAFIEFLIKENGTTFGPEWVRRSQARLNMLKEARGRIS